VLLVGLIGEHRASEGSTWYKRFALLITIGCGIEFLADGGVFMFSKQLQNISDAEVVTAENDASLAQKAAIDASNRATDAFGKAKDASVNATSAFNKAASAEKEAGENKLEAGELQLRAEKEAAKRVAIEQQLAWRTFTKEQEKHLAFRLPSRFAGTTLIVANVMGDAEGRSYAGALWDALSKAGWGNSENPGLKGTGIGNPRALFEPAAVPEGLEIIERGKPEAALLLRKTMLDSGIEVNMISIPLSTSNFILSEGRMSPGMTADLDASIPINTLELLVGVKPHATPLK